MRTRFSSESKSAAASVRAIVGSKDRQHAIADRIEGDLGEGEDEVVGRLAGPTTTILASLAVYWLNFLCFAGAAYFLGVRRQGLSWPSFGLRPFPLRWLGVGLLAAVALLPLRACAALAAQVTLGGAALRFVPARG